MKSLKTKLVNFLTESPQHLQKIYDSFPEEKQSTIRGRLNENINKCFRRIARGTYLATVGNSQLLLIEGDAWEVIKDIEDSCIDAIITDSGYTCLNEFVATGTTRKKSNELTFRTKDIDLELLAEFERVLKPGGHFFSFLPADSAKTLDYNNRFINMAISSGFQFNKRFIWDKQCISMGYNGRAKYEQVIFLSKGKRQMPHDLSISDCIDCKRIAPANKIHEAEKPVELLEALVKFCSREGDVILDPFAGSMSTAKACLRHNRNAVCVEISPKIIGEVLPHLKKEVEVVTTLRK